MTNTRPHQTPAVPPRHLMIRGARRDDVDDVAAIEKRAFSDPWSANSFRALFGNPLVHFAVAEDGITGRILGYVVTWFVVDEGEIANLAVAPSGWGAGHQKESPRRTRSPKRSRSRPAASSEMGL